mgnify:CR=1 FL=1
MNHLLRVLALGALLHDLGKVVRRAGGGRETHSAEGAAFLSPFCHESEDGRQILQCIKYHHGKALSGANLPTDALAYVVYEADNIAAGLDQRELGVRVHIELGKCMQPLGKTKGGQSFP